MLTAVFWLSLYIFHENTTFFFFIDFAMTSEFPYFLTSSLFRPAAVNITRQETERVHSTHTWSGPASRDPYTLGRTGRHALWAGSDRYSMGRTGRDCYSMGWTGRDRYTVGRAAW